MSKTKIEIFQELLQGATRPEVVNAFVAEDATCVSITFNNPDPTRIMPWAGMHRGDGRASILQTLVDVNTSWVAVDLVPQHILGDGDNEAVFGSFTLRSRKLGKQFTSPFAVLAAVKNGQVISMRYMEDTFGTGATFRSGGEAKYESIPAGGEVVI